MADDSDAIARIALGIAGALGATDPGEKAQARRMDEQGAPLFWRQVARLGISPSQEQLWLRFTRMVALLTPASATESIHQSGRRLGAVLADGGDAGADLRASSRPFLSEQRLARLLASRDEARLEALERAIRMVGRSRPRLDVVSLARTVMSAESNALARDYYARIDRSPAREVEHA
ncbi:type I-E CRISPR-associated protein Cse2/CasB [Ancylobacter radicis]|uniref:Type I-E CRISPR-associated protein Cse2/CasB n=1 Tax=Ancylobacter radicis TaxID=2836179 RepID=A0ABS5RBE5_9HYPH|nr:type I-E CRISPR-associated protein Cse2/CasB [Ancylobacter radicis]MBS9478976.1 type I-E CRISPR-associated protein Cse2/CasB [Ancylobacter radicis]